MPITKSTKAPRGTNLVVKAFFRELSETGGEADQPAIAKAAVAKINAQIKEAREKAKAAKEKAKAKAAAKPAKTASAPRKAGAKRAYTRRAPISSITTSVPTNDGLVN